MKGWTRSSCPAAQVRGRLGEYRCSPSLCEVDRRGSFLLFVHFFDLQGGSAECISPYAHFSFMWMSI